MKPMAALAASLALAVAGAVSTAAAQTCPRGLKAAACACVQSCPAGYEDRGTTCVYRSQGSGGGGQ
jgi:hypothetical protein